MLMFSTKRQYSKGISASTVTNLKNVKVSNRGSYSSGI